MSAGLSFLAMEGLLLYVLPTSRETITRKMTFRRRRLYYILSVATTLQLYNWRLITLALFKCQADMRCWVLIIMCKNQDLQICVLKLNK